MTFIIVTMATKVLSCTSKYIKALRAKHSIVLDDQQVNKGCMVFPSNHTFL